MDIIFLGGHVLDINLVKNIHHQQEISHLKTTLEFSKHTVILTLLTKRYLDCWMNPRHVSDVCLQPLLSPSLLTTLCRLFFVLFCLIVSTPPAGHMTINKTNGKICLSRSLNFSAVLIVVERMKNKHFNCTHSLVSFSVKSRKNEKRKKTNKKKQPSE